MVSYRHSRPCCVQGYAVAALRGTELGHDVITVSLSGHRPSQGLVTFQTLRRYVRDAHTPVDVLGLADEEVVFVGHSMGGIVCQQVLARYPQTAGCVVVDCVAQHHALDTYLPVMRWLFRRHPRTALAAMVNAAALFGSDALVRELLLGEDAGDDVIAALRPHLGGETAVAIPVMLAAKLRGQQPLDGQKLLFLSAQRSAFYPTSLVEVSAREYGTRCVLVDGPHNLMLLPQSALLAAQAIEAFLVTLRTDPSALFASPRRAREYLFDAQTPEETVTWYLAQAWCHDSGLAMADMMAAKSQPLRTQRMLFLAGRQDASLSLRAIRASAAFLHAPLVELDRPHDGMLAGDWQGAADAVWACVQQISAEVRNP